MSLQSSRFQLSLSTRLLLFLNQSVSNLWLHKTAIFELRNLLLLKVIVTEPFSFRFSSVATREFRKPSLSWSTITFQDQGFMLRARMGFLAEGRRKEEGRLLQNPIQPRYISKDLGSFLLTSILAKLLPSAYLTYASGFRCDTRQRGQREESSWGCCVGPDFHRRLHPGGDEKWRRKQDRCECASIIALTSTSYCLF